MKHYKSEKSGLRLLLYISLVINMLLISFWGVACLKTDMCKKLLAKIGLTDYNHVYTRHQIEYRCLEGWANCLNQQKDSIDIVFYGNSITYESNFQMLFPDIKICNLGCNRDDLDDLIHRSFLINSLHPRKVFLLGGINSIINVPLEEFEHKYRALVDTIRNQNPYAQLYLQTLLPVNVEMEIGSRYRDCQWKIKEANAIIKNIALSKGYQYVDLFAAYQINDSMPRKYTRDGLHLYLEAYSIWAQVIYPYMVE